MTILTPGLPPPPHCYILQSRECPSRGERLLRVRILGVGIHNCDEDGAVGAIERFLREASPGPHQARQVATVNPEFIMEARHNRPFRDLLNNADLATPDGVGIVLAARLLGTPVKGRATGVA